MKSKLTIIALMLFTLSASGFSQMKLAYVNSQMVLAGYAPAIEAKKQLEAQSAKWTQELQTMTEAFQTSQQKLEQQSLLLSDAKKKEKAQELQQTYMQIQQFQQEKWGDDGELARKEKELLQPVIDRVNEVINKVGDDGGYDFIFDAIAGNLLYAKDAHDITQKVIDALK